MTTPSLNYTLGYYLDTKNNKPGWRKLQVKVGKSDVEVRARNGFFVTNATNEFPPQPRPRHA